MSNMSKTRILKQSKVNMDPRAKYRMICPECGAAVLTGYPEAVVWEVCPVCRHHIWDVYDARMADKVSQEAGFHERVSHVKN